MQQTLGGTTPRQVLGPEMRLPRPVGTGNQLQMPPLASARSLGPQRLSVGQLLRWVEGELQFQSQKGVVTCEARVCIFASVFGQVVEMMPEYRPILLAVQREYEELIALQQEQLNAIAPLEGRLKTLKADSYSFVCESSALQQTEIACLRQRLKTAEQGIQALRQEKVQLLEAAERVKDEAKKDRASAVESHVQNLDIIKYLERRDKDVETLRKQETELQIDRIRLEQSLKDKDNQIQTVEGQLNLQREKCDKMVPRTELEAVREEVRQLKLRNKELEEAYNSKQKDYMSIVETYSKSIGQQLTGNVRPLTPRPLWQQCHGLLDADLPGSADKAQTAQEILQKTFSSSRIILSAYGLSAFTQKSTLLQTYARSGIVSFLAPDKIPVPRLSVMYDAPHSHSNDETRSTFEDNFFQPTADSLIPWQLHHAHEITNLIFSRKRTSTFIENLLQLRLRDSGHNQPFLDFMLRHLPNEVKKEDSLEFTVNIWMAVRHFAAEPDFLAYLLLILGKIPDHVVRDNRRMVKELLALFASMFKTADGMKRISKQKFLSGIREVLPNKEKDMCYDIVHYLPAGGSDVLVNYEALLHDDACVLSPVTYALRHQHLEEAVALSDRMEKAVMSCMDETSNMVSYGKLAEYCNNDSILNNLLPEDFAKALGIPMALLNSGTEKEARALLDNLRHSNLFHILYFPELPAEDAEDDEGDAGAAQGEMH